MKAFLTRFALFSIPVLGLAISVFFMPYDREHAYRSMFAGCGEQGRWIWNRIFINPNPVDVAFIGSSHTMSAVQDSIINAGLRARGSRLSVANMGFCRGGRDLLYEISKDLILQKKPKLLVIEVTEREESSSHPDFPHLASRDNLFNPPSRNEQYFEIMLTGLNHRWEYQKSRLFRSGFIPDQYPVPDYSYFGHDHLADSGELANWKREQELRYKGVKDNWAVPYPEKWVSAIAGLARQHGVLVAFLYLPEYGSPVPRPLNSSFYSEYGTTLFLPDSVLRNPANWTDPAHLNKDAAAVLAPYIITQIETLLKPQQ